MQTTDILTPSSHDKSDRSSGLRRNLSIYLDLMRFLAAFEVFLTHSKNFLMPSLPKILASHGGEAVAVFFVLSGFVISFVTTEKELDWRSYVIARAARLFSVTFIALVAVFLVDSIGRYGDSSVYKTLSFFDGNYLLNFFSVFLFGNEAWFAHVVWGSNEPYWSLGFECAYYVFFGLVFFVPPKYRMPALTIWLAIYGPKIALYLPLWLLGVLTYKIIQKKKFEGLVALPIVMIGSSISLYYLCKKFLSIQIVPMFEWHSVSNEFHSFIYFMLIGIAVLVNLVAIDALLGNRNFFPMRIEKAIRWFAGASFTLYLVHEPCLIALSALMPEVKSSAISGLLALAGIFILVLVLSELGERRKSVFTRIIKKFPLLSR